MSVSEDFKLNFWDEYYWVRSLLFSSGKKIFEIFIILIILLLFVMFYIYRVELRELLLPFIKSSDQQSNLRIIFITLGSTLAGTTAIIFSLVTFALQINVDKLPNGLFRKVSTDKKILITYMTSFLLSISIIFLSLIDIHKYVHYLCAITITAILLVIYLLYSSYKRALYIINPHNQIQLLYNDTAHNFKLIQKHADRISPMFESEDLESQPQDMPRVRYFIKFHDWNLFASHAIHHANAFHKRYSEIGDYEVSKTALDVVAYINVNYVKVKGKTFFNSEGFFDNPYTGDKFINETLEMLRQNIHLAISKRDEYQIEQNFNALFAMCTLYYSIDYGKDYYSTKHHAELAATYLADAVESLIPHDMADLLMTGVRLLGRVAIMDMQYTIVELAPMPAKRIYSISMVSALKKEYHPVLKTGIEQFASITIALLNTKSSDIQHASKDIRNYMADITKNFIQFNAGSISDASVLFDAYYTNLPILQFPVLVEMLYIDSVNEDEKATLTRNFILWSEQIYSFEKDLLLFTIQQKSNFFFSVSHWITGVAKMLIEVTNSPGCSETDKEDLNRNIEWLIYVFDWIPKEQESMSFVENYNVHESLFEVGYFAHKNENEEIAGVVGKLLLEWAFRAGIFDSRMASFERGLYVSTALSYEMDRLDSFISDLRNVMATDNIPSRERRLRAKEDFDNYLSNLNRRNHFNNQYDQILSQVVHSELENIFDQIGAVIYPEGE